MATSDVEICKMALSHIRGGSINSLTEASLQAQQCSLLYPNARDMALSFAPWGFNKKVDTLALRSDTVFGWAYLYQYPADAIRINKLIMNYSAVEAGNGVSYHRRSLELLTPADLHGQIPYKVYNAGGDRVIASNVSDLRIEYGIKMTDVSKFDIEFDMALSHLLGSMLAIPIVGGDTGAKYQETQYALYKTLEAEAIATDLNENFLEQPESDFVTVRI